MNEADLIVAARAGDADAFGRLAATHAAAARRVAMLLGAGDDADDVVQEALVKAYRRLSDYRGEAAFRAWLVAIVTNETRNLHRSRRRRDEARQRAQALVEALRVEPEPPEVAALASAQRSDLVAALRGLSDADRDVIAYRYLLGLSEAETAEALAWPRGTVKSRTSRALARLRSRLGVAVAATVLAVVAVVAIPPARTAVADVIDRVLRFAGVELTVRRVGALPVTGSPLPSVGQVSLAQARAAAKFQVLLPAALGEPEQVFVADPGPDGAPRVVSLRYSGGAITIDEFDGIVDLSFAKTVPGVVWLDIAGAGAAWVPEPHELTYVDRAGRRVTATTRLAGPTLLWQVGPVAVRIEGVPDVNEAIAIAVSMT